MSILDQLMDEPLPEVVRNWSDYQNAFFEIVSESQDSVQLEAVAGSGKSTTLCEVPNRAEGPIIFLAFMRANVDDLKARVERGEVKTFNGLGHGILFGQFRYAKLDKSKLHKLLPQAAGGDLGRDFGSQIMQVVRLDKSDCVGIGREPEMWDFFDVIQRHETVDVPEEMTEQVAHAAHRLYTLSIKELTIFDFDDQLYMPVLLDLTFPVYRTIIVDEDQDLSPIQHTMLERLQQRSGGRIIGAGDRRQAIYAFRGALANSVDLLKSRFAMREAPLSISYRCATSIVNEARKYCPQIEARPGAPEGAILEHREDPEFWSPEQMVLCRTNAPLFRAILRYVRKGRMCQVKSTFLEQLESFVRKLKASTMLDFRNKLDQWYVNEKHWAEKKGQKSKLMLLKDKYDTLLVIAEQCKQPYEIVALLKYLAESKQGTTFSTIHKAKGLEASSVYILRPDLMPAPWVDPEHEEELQQEYNMLYVAITRAKEELIYGAKKQP
jgi:DNA helicase-2/ATP-dependent DNA helicase PcrA